ncbi:hypothetical protein [Methylomusa anaerophila]|nr:hypothetical protein [Methylomusa anaerophila]
MLRWPSSTAWNYSRFMILLGGAKPYGYGKVRITVKQVMLEKKV